MEERDNNQNASMVFTLQDEHNALPDAHEQDAWETAPHDWCEPESPAEYGTADPAAYAPQAAAPVSAADDIPEPPPQSEAQEAPFRPAADESAAVHGTQAEENEQSADEQFADEVAAAALDALNQAENDSQETADEAPSEPAIIRDPAAVPDYRLPDPPPADDEPAPEREKPLAERAAELPAGSLAARIAGLHAPEALADHSDSALPEPAPVKPSRETTPEEREYGRLRYLQHLADEHNRNLFDDSGEQNAILIQEDWLAAQNALESEQSKEFLLPVHTHALKSPETPDAPEITVHVYNPPELPIGKRVKILSEEALIDGIRSRLQPHIANAVAGLTHRVLLRKTAALSYDLQMQLNEEVPQVVEEILQHHLDEIIHLVKREATHEEVREYTAVPDDENV